jgi:NIPSNAP
VSDDVHPPPCQARALASARKAQMPTHLQVMAHHALGRDVSRHREERPASLARGFAPQPKTFAAELLCADVRNAQKVEGPPAAAFALFKCGSLIAGVHLLYVLFVSIRTDVLSLCSISQCPIDEVKRLAKPPRPRRHRMRTFATFALHWLAALPAAANAQDRYVCRSNGSELQQLRIYEINRGNRDAFHRRFQDHALRIMKRHSFKIIDMWESDTGEKIEFVYLLSWPDKDTMDSRWKEFLADQEWIDIKKRTAAASGELVREANGQPLVRVSYSPACARR